MAAGVISTKGETEAHARLKRLAFVWAQAQGFSACAMEVCLPKCRYRADVAAYRWLRKQIGSTAVFECKQALCDLRRDNCHSEAARRRLDAICKRRRVLETCLREHYPNLRNGDSLFPEFDPQAFTAIGHRAYARLLHDLRAAKSSLRLHQVRQVSSLPLRELVLSCLARAIVSRTGDSGRLGRARGIRWRAHTHPKTCLARNECRQSHSLPAANRCGWDASAKSTTGSHIRRRDGFALSIFLIVGCIPRVA